MEERKPGRPRKPLMLSECGEVLNVEEVARVLRVDRKSVYGAVARGMLPALRFGRALRIPKWQVEKLLQGGEAANAFQQAATGR